MRFKPHDYQKHAIDKIIQDKAVGLFLDLGLGKTVITLTAVSDLLHDYFAVKRVLVIAPKRVAEDTWSRETEKWDHTKHLRISKILGSREKRLAALEAEADIYIINRENVKWLVEHYKQKWPFDMVVIDELSSFKSSKSQRFRALRKVRGRIDRIIGLTGTPSPNGLIDLWPQLYLLDQGQRLGKTLTVYRDEYFKPGRRNPTNGIIYEWNLRDGCEEMIYKQIDDICISMKADDYLKMPDRIDREVKVPLSDRLLKQYKKFEKDLLMEFTESDVVADTAAVLSNKLLQFANGAIYDENEDVQYLHDQKLEALEDLQEAQNGKPLLVFYSYKHDRDRILERFPDAKQLDGSGDIEKWNKGEIPMLLAHPASAGHGLNLQDGGSQVVWFGIPWSLELYQQANGRVHRQGQKQTVIIHHLIADGTIDEDVVRALAGKAEGQNALLEAVRARLERVRDEIAD